MRRIIGLAGCAVVAAWLLTGVADAQSPGSRAVLEGGTFVQDFTKQVADYYDREIARLVLMQQNASANQRSYLDQEIRRLSERKRLAAGYDKGWRIFNCAKNIHDTLDQIENSLNQSDTWSRQIVWLDRMAGAQLAQARELIQQANTAQDYVSKFQALMGLLKGFDEAVPSDQVKGMIDGLNGLFWAMQEYGDTVPALGQFVQKYGEVGNALTNACWRLHQRLQGRAGGLLVDGYRDDGRVAAFDRQFPHLAGTRDMLEISPLPGVRDAYALPNRGGVLVWDARGREWYQRHDMTPEQLVRRYAFCATYGEPNPTVEMVLSDHPSQIIGVRLVPADKVIAPGASTTITVSARSMEGGVPITMLSLWGTQEATTASYLGARPGGGSVDPTKVEPTEDKTVTWTAPPDRENYVYRVSAGLARGERGMVVGTPYCVIATGIRTRLAASANPDTVQPGGSGTIVFQLLGSSNQPLKTLGRIRIYGNGLEITDAQWAEDGTRGWAAYHAPMQEGLYKPLVSFSGYIDAGMLYGINTLASQAEVQVRVKAAQQTATVPPQPTPTPGGQQQVYVGELTQEWRNHRESEMRAASARSRSVLESYSYQSDGMAMAMKDGVATVSPAQINGRETYDYRVTANARPTRKTSDFTFTFQAGQVNADGSIDGAYLINNRTTNYQGDGKWRGVTSDGGRTYLIYLVTTQQLPPMYRLQRAQ